MPLCAALLCALTGCGRQEPPKAAVAHKTPPVAIASAQPASADAASHRDTPAAGPVAQATSGTNTHIGPDFIPERLTPDSDPKGRIAERIALDKELNQVLSDMARQSSILRKETQAFYESDPEVKAMATQALGYQKQVKDRMDAAPGRHALEADCTRLDVELGQVRSQLAELTSQDDSRRRPLSTAENDQVSVLRATESELLSKRSESRASLARLEMETVAGDAQIAQWRAAASVLQSNIHVRAAASVKLRELRDRQAALAARRAVLLARLEPVEDASVQTGAHATNAAPIWTAQARSTQ